jgi:hypothetical protein
VIPFRSVRDYAKEAGKKVTTVQDRRAAAKAALACSDIRTLDLSPRWQCLVEVRKAPEWLWPALVDHLDQDGGEGAGPKDAPLENALGRAGLAHPYTPPDLGNSERGAPGRSRAPELPRRRCGHARARRRAGWSRPIAERGVGPWDARQKRLGRASVAPVKRRPNVEGGRRPSPPPTSQASPPATAWRRAA